MQTTDGPLALVMRMVGVVLIVGVGAPALAQRPIEPEPGEELRVPFTPDHLNLLEQRCALTPEQLDAADMLAEEFRAAFEEAGAPIRSIQEEMSNIDWSMPDARSQWRSLRDRRNTLRDDMRTESLDLQRDLLENIKLLLSDEQVELGWDSFERVRLRRAYLPQIPFLGLRGDVEGVLDELVKNEMLTTAEVDSLRPIIDRWEVALDRPVGRIGTVMREAEDKFREMRQNPDIEAINRWLDDVKKVLGRVKAAHERASREIEAQLGAEKGALFANAFIRDRFPDIYAETDLSGEIERVRRVVADLTEEQVGRIDAIAARFDRDVETVRRDMIAAQEKMIMEVTAINLATGFDESEYEALEEKAEELMDTARDRVRGVLTREQMEKAGDAEAAAQEERRAREREAREGRRRR